MKAKDLLEGAVEVMADVLVHQRARWGPLLQHERQYEGWWKAEMALALESWSWRADHLDWPLAVLPEAKPRDFHMKNGPPSADLLVGKTSDFIDPDPDSYPRLWIELKERSTWWGTTKGRAAKAFGTGNHGLWSDIQKWKRVRGPGEVVVVCQVTSHAGTYSEQLPATWREELDSIAKEHDRVMERCVGFETAGDDNVVWSRFDCFVLNRGS